MSLLSNIWNDSIPICGWRLMCCESDLFQRSHSVDDEVTKNASHMTAITDAAVSPHPHASICSLEVFHCRTALLKSLHKSVPLTRQESVWPASNMLDICYVLTHAHLSSLLHWSVHYQPVNWTSTIQYIYSMCPSLKANCKTKTSFHFPLWGKIFNFGCNSRRDSLLAPSPPCWICLLPES